MGRKVPGVFIAPMDGLKGLPDAIEAAYPRTRVGVAERYRRGQRGGVDQCPAAEGEEAPAGVSHPGSARRVLYVAITKASDRWPRPVQDWTAALNHMSIVFERRIPV